MGPRPAPRAPLRSRQRPRRRQLQTIGTQPEGSRFPVPGSPIPMDSPPPQITGRVQPEELPRLSLIQHPQELRSRIPWSLPFAALAFFPCFWKGELILAFLQKPITAILPPGKRLAYMGITDPIILYFKVAGLAALFASSPLLLHQLWKSRNGDDEIGRG